MFNSTQPSPQPGSCSAFLSGFAATVVTRARTRSCMLAILLSPLVLAPSARADEASNATEPKNCTSQIALCASGVGGAAAGIITQCKALRKAKKECRLVKRDCSKAARVDKRACIAACHGEFGNGKDARECASACRADKRATKDGCKADQTECKEIAVFDYKTPECVAARRAALLSVPACATMVSCLAGSAKTEAQ